MRVAALVLGILGGIAGLTIGIIALVVGSLVESVGADRGLVVILLALISMVAGGMALSKPTLAGMLMLFTGIGGFVVISLAYIFVGPLLIAGGIMALMAKEA